MNREAKFFILVKSMHNLLPEPAEVTDPHRTSSPLC